MAKPADDELEAILSSIMDYMQDEEHLDHADKGKVIAALLAAWLTAFDSKDECCEALAALIVLTGKLRGEYAKLIEEPIN